LPAKDGSVRPDEDFAMSWEVDTASKKRVADIANALKGADGLILATDPDREGEAISWHILDVLRQKKALKKDTPVQRVVFNAITKDAVTTAMAHPRDVDMPLVDAYLARRALDYLVGFTLSPILWRKLPGSRSAGRVQSSPTAKPRSKSSRRKNTGLSKPRSRRTARALLRASSPSMARRPTSSTSRPVKTPPR
jgi:DNA topoisomerase-1